MCGIAGVIDIKAQDKEKIIGEMTSKIFHRGPDEDGFYVDSNVGLGMRRLSIIDLSSGKQPITSADEKLLIFFNGEIYNYKELRKEIEDDFFWKTHSDTEVILHMYEKYGEKMLSKLRGMFAFSIYNREKKEIFIARDFFGIKPLYYLRQNNKITAFGSEIKSFLSIPGFKTELNEEALQNYFSFQYNTLDETFFKNVWKLPPAHYLKINIVSGEEKMERYWQYEINQDENLKEGETTQKIKETIFDSVEHHMIADVPVGAFLSGGVDSSIIATTMQKVRGDSKIKTFTVGFDTLTEGNESKETSDFLGTDHTEIKIGKNEYFDILPKAVWHFDEPVGDPSAIGLYFVAREARKHVTVVLSGEGADELFGGYNIYLAPFAYKKVSWLPKVILGLFLKVPFGFWGKNYIRRATEKIDDWYIGNASVFKKDEIKKLYRNADVKLHSLKPLYQKIEKLSDSSKMQYVDIHTWLIGDILAKADKMTMANSLELRVPFLDTKVAGLANTLPDKFKWKNGASLFGGQVTKYLLREAFSSVIPESTRNRKKLGFPTPVRDWFTADRGDIYQKILENEYIKKNFDIDYIKSLIKAHTNKSADNSRKIYLLLMFSLWWNEFMK